MNATYTMLQTPVIALGRVGPKTVKNLKKLGIETVEDLLLYFPFRHEDLSHVASIASVRPNEVLTIRAKVELIENKRSQRQRKNLTEALVSDTSGSIRVVWFNQPFLKNVLRPGMEVWFSGKPMWYGHELYLSNPEYEIPTAENLHTARIRPIYHLTEGLSQKQMRFFTHEALPFASRLEEWLPEEVLLKYQLLPFADAIVNFHFPQSQEMLAKAERRLKWNELFMLQLFTQKARRALKKERAERIPFHEELTKSFVASLPFTLTDHQKGVGWEILKDLDFDEPMNRLLQGDVGSGKTVVAALALVNVWKAGFQSALMAATEILAKQHYEKLRVFFASLGVRVALLTSSYAEAGDEESIKKSALLKRIEDGSIDVVVGTHAVIEKKVRFKNLAFAVIDEQHRFGVDQRRRLRQKEEDGAIPHFLSMTATPIPRSLALAIYGDLDISTIRQMPVGRKPILTRLVPKEKRSEAYRFIEAEIAKGRQVFIVCPLVSPSDKLGAKSVEEEFEKLQKTVFKKTRIGLLHGKLKSEEKEAVMRRFQNHELDILVATSIIEVGIDIPNATIMMIENAERFGLAQLHQFRGRVGRGGDQAYCFVFSDSAESSERLQVFERVIDGFTLAEKDLEFRGHGEIYGERQSGMDELRIATLFDYDILTEAKEAAETLLEQDPDIVEYPLLRERLEKREGKVHFE